MLKTQLAPLAAPLACYWPARSAHPMKQRIAMLKQSLPDRPRRLMGLALVVGLSLGAGVVAWAAQPARVETVMVTRTGPAPPSIEAARAQADRAQAAADLAKTEADRAARDADKAQRQADEAARTADKDALDAERGRLDAERASGEAEAAAKAHGYLIDAFSQGDPKVIRRLVSSPSDLN
jgi:pimeloyl-ACP methyl ester carboxylesterase